MFKLDLTSTFDECLLALLPRNSFIAISTYRSGSVLLGFVDKSVGIVWYKWNHEIPSGLSSDGHSFYIATVNAIKVFPLIELAEFFKQGRFLRNGSGYQNIDIKCHKTLKTGPILCHEIYSSNDEKSYLVNTRFSAISAFENERFWEDYWIPPFVSEWSPEDFCHLNGLAISNSIPSYASCLAGSNIPRGWRLFPSNSGLLIDVLDNKVICSGLTLPHSPRCIGDQLFFLQSGVSSLCVMNLITHEVKTIAELPGFARGMTLVNGFAIIGLSTIRESNLWNTLPVKLNFPDSVSGVVIVDLANGHIVSKFSLADSLYEIFDIQIITLPAFV